MNLQAGVQKTVIHPITFSVTYPTNHHYNRQDRYKLSNQTPHQSQNLGITILMKECNKFLECMFPFATSVYLLNLKFSLHHFIFNTLDIHYLPHKVFQLLKNNRQSQDTAQSHQWEFRMSLEHKMHTKHHLNMTM